MMQAITTPDQDQQKRTREAHERARLKPGEVPDAAHAVRRDGCRVLYTVYTPAHSSTSLEQL